VRIRQEIQAMSWPPELSSLAFVDVVVGIVTDADERVLIACRPAGKHMAGSWEFPGGKIEAGESALAGLRRELAEEVGVTVTAAEQLLKHEFDYPDRTVRLDVWWVSSWHGTVQSREGQRLKWVEAHELKAEQMLPADRPLVDAVCERLTTS
jgi:8-oxo-dGTP diphosphatase